LNATPIIPSFIRKALIRKINLRDKCKFVENTIINGDEITPNNQPDTSTNDVEFLIHFQSFLRILIA